MARNKKDDTIFPFDTLSCAKRLQAAGFTREQSEAQAETFLAVVREQLVSKRDLRGLEERLTVKIEGLDFKVEMVKKDLDLKVEIIKKDLKIWFGGMLAVAVTVLSTIMTLITHLVH